MLKSGVIRDLLVNAQSGRDALATIYAAAKEAQPNLSLSALCRKAQITSKGYLSDVFNGRRQLNKLYWDSLAGALGVDGLDRQYLHCLLQQDTASNHGEKQECERQLAELKKSFSVQLNADPSALKDCPFAFEVFAAFGLFGSQPTRDQLVGYFGRDRFPEVDRAIRVLQLANLIRPEGSHLELTSEHIVFSHENNSNHLTHLEFLRHAIAEAGKNAPHWFKNTSNAYFEASIVSASKMDYQKKLHELKELLLKWQSDLESANSDTLIRFNVQIYPVEKT